MSPENRDEELLQVYAEEALERLGTMTTLLLQLDSTRADPEVTAALFREAHTVKGGASMVGLDSVSTLAHQMEDVLSEVRDGQRPVTPELVDALLAVVESLSSIVPVAAMGDEHETQVAASERALAEAVGSEPAPPAEPERLLEQPTQPEHEPDRAPEQAPQQLPEQAAHAPAPAPSSRAPGTAPGERLAVPIERLDELVRLVGETVAGQLRLGALLRQALGRDPEGLEEFRSFTHILQELQDVAMRTRMVPVSKAVPGLQRAVRELARARGKQARLDVLGGETELDRRVLDQLTEVLLHLVRNSVDHGIESPADRLAAGKAPEAVIGLEATQSRSEAIVVVSDDGRGIDLERIREKARRSGGLQHEISDEEALGLIFSPGFSTSTQVDEISGRGVGLDVVRTRLEAIQGRVDVRSQPGVGTRFRITVPLTLAVVNSLLVTAGGQRFALPMQSVAGIVPPNQDERSAGGRGVVVPDGHPVPVATLAATLGLDGGPQAMAAGPTVLLAGHSDQHAFRIDQVLGQRQVVVKGLSQVLPRLPVVGGASVEPDGAILLMLEPAALIERALGLRPGSEQLTISGTGEPATRTSSRVLVVDDARIVREMERSILEQAGYEVVTAKDGVEALAALVDHPCDLVVTDIEMPQMDGLQLTAEIRRLPRTAQLPVILLTSRSDDETRRKGLEVGADGYVVKAGFDQFALLEHVQKALGHR
jgi:two-component system chemotaxis sensor kinase CheA